MKVAICDNDIRVQKLLFAYVQDYEMKYARKFQIMCFQSGEDLLAATEHFDVIFLDIEMENLNGMETAAYIRKTDIDVAIIILSGYAKYKQTAYALHVFDYLDKPFHKDDIYHVLQEVERYHVKNEYTYISFRSKQGMLKLKKEDIIYIEFRNRTTWIHTQTTSYDTTYTIAELIKKLEIYDFYSPHRAFIINLYHVFSYTSTTITLDDKMHTEVPISQLKSKECKEKILLYLTKVAMMV